MRKNEWGRAAKRWAAKSIGILAAVSLLAAGCGKGEEEGTVRDEEKIEAQKLAQSVKEKYAKEERYEYGEAIRDIERDESLKLEMGFDIMNAGFDEYPQIAAVYQDPELTQRVGTHYEWDEEKQVLSITPPRWNAGGISASQLDPDVPGNEPGALELFDKGELKDWGNLPQYYLAQYVDAKTGEKLNKPLVRVVTVKHEVSQTPRLSISIDDDGLPVFSWQEVKGADNYYVMELGYDQESGYSGAGQVIGETSDTKWKPEQASDFRTFSVSEAERSEDYNIEQYGEGTEPIYPEEVYETYYCVIAVSKKGTSAVSNTFHEQDIARRVPYMEETKMSLEKEGSNYADGFGNMPSYKWVTMCDGTLVQKLLEYDFEQAQRTTEQWGEYEKEDMSDLRLVDVDLVKVPYTIEGTGFTGVVKVQNFNADTWEEDLKEIEKRQEDLRNRAGTRDLEMKEETEEEEESGREAEEEEVYQTEYEITANSALSEYLAANMLTGTAMIDLSEFPESADQEYLADAWMEAVYQNPMILGVRSAAVSGDGKTMLVQYDTTPETMEEKQKEIAAEVDRVTGEIIREDMSELEKELAINQYLCDTAEYDMEALENAEENQFQTVDEEYSDSFTPYGVLLNQKGVCASYSGAFKLLAQAAGLDCIVVTGNLEGNLPHAWNKVKVDGEWQIVDSTNNDNEQLFNALLNLPDRAAGKVLVEDELFVLDSKLGDYGAPSDEKEYYRLQDKFFEQDQIAASLADELQEGDRATLRTDYDLNDQEFETIAQKVLEDFGGSELAGYYWMGVIYLEGK